MEKKLHIFEDMVFHPQKRQCFLFSCYELTRTFPIWDIPELSIQYNGQIIRKTVLVSQDYKNDMSIE